MHLKRILMLALLLASAMVVWANGDPTASHLPKNVKIAFTCTEQ